MEVFLRGNISKSKHHFRIMEQTFTEINYDGNMAMEIGRELVLVSSRNFKMSVRTILDITSLDWFSLDKSKEAERIFNLSWSSFGGGSIIINLKSSNYFLLWWTKMFWLFLWRVWLDLLLVKVLFFLHILSLYISVASQWD